MASNAGDDGQICFSLCLCWAFNFGYVFMKTDLGIAFMWRVKHDFVLNSPEMMDQFHVSLQLLLSFFIYK